MRSLPKSHSFKGCPVSVQRSLGLGVALAAVASASAQTTTKTVVVTDILPFSDTNWSDALRVDGFNKPLVHLDSVDIVFNGAVKGSMRFENRNSNARTYSANVAYGLFLTSPAGNVLLSLVPSSNTASGTLAAFDGVADYAGTSGITLPNLSATDSGTVSLTSETDLAAFRNAGKVAFPVDASAASTVRATGNFDKEILNQAAADIKVTYRYSYTPASVGDKVFVDANGDGIQQTTEKGVSGVKVSLLDKDGNVVTTTTTDGSGVYGFADLEPGDYKVKFDAPAGTSFTAQGAGGDRELDSDVDGSGNTASFTLHSGEARKDLDAGIVGLQSLGDRVWLDANGNGLQDAGEPGLTGIGVSLLDTAGNVLGTTTTGDDGKYLFTGLLTGSYVVRFDPIGGYNRTAPGVGGDRALDSDADADGKSGTVVLNAGDNRTDVDAGYKGALMLGDRVFFDANANGVQDPSEVGISGVKVSLLKADGTPVLDANGLAITSVTDSTGGYLFSDLLPGDYKVKFDKPSGYTFSGRDAGGNDALDSDADGSGITEVIALTQDNLNVDAGLYGTLCVGDRVWKDLDKDGLQDACEPGVPGVKVTLLDKDGNVLGSTTTNANGYYSFTNLVPGDYVVDFDAPDGYGFTKQFANASYKGYDSNADVTTGRAYVSLDKNDSTIDAGLIGALKIGDTVWLDCDGDKVFDVDQGERGIPCVRVYLLGDTNNDGKADVAASTVTDKDGHYKFLGLNPGTYSVTVNPFDLPANVGQTTHYGTNLPYVAIGRLLPTGDNLDFDFGYKPCAPSTGCHPKWWSCNLPKWSWDCLWIGKKCHTKATVCAWMKREDCGDKSISLYQRLCAAKLNVGNGCNEGKVYTCGKTCISLKEAIRRADEWMGKYPVGCNVKDKSAAWTSICDVFAILDAHCNGR